MKWIKKGRIFDGSEHGWMSTHGAVPFAQNLSDDLYRIYFSSRTKDNKSQTTFLEINIQEPTKILHLSKEPILKIGQLGSFDDSGAMCSCIVDFDNKKFLYYIGWNGEGSIPFRNSTGLAISDDGKTFKKFADGPIMDRIPNEGYSNTNSWVIYDDQKWKMWYLSGVKWDMHENNFRPHYHIKYAESNDGINWQRNGKIAIDFKNADEWAISRPCVIKEDGIYKMWYSYRGKQTYRIGYAESQDGINWKRLDEQMEFDVSSDGWDSEMVEYPFVFNHNNQKYMLYCGNGYGKTGFGYAVLE